MESKLPKNWVEIELGSILKLKNGYAFKSKDYKNEGVPVIRISNISDGRIDLTKAAFVDESLGNENFYVRKGDILIAMSGATTGKYGIYDYDKIALQNQRVGNFELRSAKSISKKFVYHLIGVLKEQIENRAYGGAQPNISSKLIETLPIKLPPRAEQDRIVAKLDTLFGQLEHINKSLEHIPTLLKNFRQQVLTQAVTGKLTEEWRKGKELEEWVPKKKNQNYRPWKISLPNDWNVYSFGTIAEIQSNLKNPDEYPDHILVAPNHIEKYTGRLIETQLTKDIAPRSDKHYFVKGSIVYSKIRPYLSKLIIAEFDGLCSADMYPIKANVDQRFLFYYMLSQIFLQYVTTAGERSVLPKVNQKGLNNIPVPVPSYKEQQEIVKRVERLFAKADVIEAHYEALKNKIEDLPQAILHKAFKGELVPQLESDGDARELLKEIEGFRNKIKSSKK